MPNKYELPKKVIHKIKHLFAMSVDGGAASNERVIAQKMLSRILIKFGLDYSEIGKLIEASQEIEKVERLVFTSKNKIEYDATLHIILSYDVGCLIRREPRSWKVGFYIETDKRLSDVITAEIEFRVNAIRLKVKQLKKAMNAEIDGWISGYLWTNNPINSDRISGKQTKSKLTVEEISSYYRGFKSGKQYDFSGNTLAGATIESKEKGDE